MEQLKLTSSQKVYVRCIRHYFAANDQFPSLKALSELVGASSFTSALQMYQRLTRMGVVEKNQAGRYKRGPRWEDAQQIAGNPCVGRAPIGHNGGLGAPVTETHQP